MGLRPAITLLLLAAFANLAAAQTGHGGGIKIIHRIPLPPDQTAVFAQVSADGSRFGVGLDSDEVVMWDGATGREVYRLSGQGPVFTASGKLVATFGESTVRVFDAATGKRIREVDLGAPIDGMLRLPGAARLVVWTSDNRAHVYGAAVGKVLHTWPFYPDSFFAWTPDGNVLFLRSEPGGSYRAMDLRTGKPAPGFENIVRNNRVLAILPGGAQAIVEEGGHKYLVHVRTGERIKEMPELGGAKVIAGSRGHIDQRYALSGNARGRLRLIDEIEGKPLAILPLPDGERSERDHTIGLSPDGTLACVATNRSAYLLRLSHSSPE